MAARAKIVSKGTVYYNFGSKKDGGSTGSSTFTVLLSDARRAASVHSDPRERCRRCSLRSVSDRRVFYSDVACREREEASVVGPRR